MIGKILIIRLRIAGESRFSERADRNGRPHMHVEFRPFEPVGTLCPKSGAEYA